MKFSVLADAFKKLERTSGRLEMTDILAELFKKAVTEADWKKMLNAHREPLGEVVSRKAASADYVTSLPGAPDGEYVVIKYRTSFSRKKKAQETVTPMKEADGTWKVSGYFIK